MSDISKCFVKQLKGWSCLLLKNIFVDREWNTTERRILYGFINREKFSLAWEIRKDNSPAICLPAPQFQIELKSTIVFWHIEAL